MIGAGAINLETVAFEVVVVLQVPCCPLVLSPVTAILLEQVIK